MICRIIWPSFSLRIDRAQAPEAFSFSLAKLRPFPVAILEDERKGKNKIPERAQKKSCPLVQQRGRKLRQSRGRKMADKKAEYYYTLLGIMAMKGSGVSPMLYFLAHGPLRFLCSRSVRACVRARMHGRNDTNRNVPPRANTGLVRAYSLSVRFRTDIFLLLYTVKLAFKKPSILEASGILGHSDFNDPSWFFLRQIKRANLSLSSICCNKNVQLISK